mmetsp:Transcript_36446/g.109470  ORF Transcript_36446/g.109470 Transcript_36446/m.109470 type:complete len:439 (-) Transcript_36446:389-1705(-)
MRNELSIIFVLSVVIVVASIVSTHKSLVDDKYKSLVESGVPPQEDIPRDFLGYHDAHQGIRLRREELKRLRLNMTAFEKSKRPDAMTALNRGRLNFKLNVTAIDEAIEADSKRGTLKLPNILLIGAQKGGTSALARWLFSHGVCRPIPFPGENAGYHRKEAHYFDIDSRYEQGIKFYAKRFYHCSDATYEMDATPAYLAYPERVRKTYDEAGNNQAESLKIVVILREPVARDLSAYNHKASLFKDQSTKNNMWRNAVDKSGDLLSFNAYTKKAFRYMLHPEGPCASGPISFCFGLYALFLKRWMNLFRHNQILILSYDELIRNEAKLIWRLRTFLGLEIENDAGVAEIEQVNSKHGVHKISLPPCLVQKKMAKTYDITNNELYELLATKKAPSMEQRPFPNFVLSNCVSKDGRNISSYHETTAGLATENEDSKIDTGM